MHIIYMHDYLHFNIKEKKRPLQRLLVASPLGITGQHT